MTAKRHSNIKIRASIYMLLFGLCFLFSLLPETSATFPALVGAFLALMQFVEHQELERKQ